jgi:hypothetical protein
MLWYLPGETNPAREENETGQIAEGRDRLSVSSKTSLASPKSEVISVRAVWCRVGSGRLTINSHAHIPFLNATLFLFRSSGLTASRKSEAGIDNTPTCTAFMEDASFSLVACNPTSIF